MGFENDQKTETVSQVFREDSILNCKKKNKNKTIQTKYKLSNIQAMKIHNVRFY